MLFIANPAYSEPILAAKLVATAVNGSVFKFPVAALTTTLDTVLEIILDIAFSDKPEASAICEITSFPTKLPAMLATPPVTAPVIAPLIAAFSIFPPVPTATNAFAADIATAVVAAPANAGAAPAAIIASATGARVPREATVSAVPITAAVT